MTRVQCEAHSAQVYQLLPSRIDCDAFRHSLDRARWTLRYALVPAAQITMT